MCKNKAEYRNGESQDRDHDQSASFHNLPVLKIPDAPLLGRQRLDFG